MDTNKIRNLNNDLCCCLQSLDSHKITERKTKRQEIQHLLENDEVIEILNYNSGQQLKKSPTTNDDYLATWRCLFNCYHRSLILVSKNNVLST
ncbi:Hypothetical protein CINCED_3A002366 [Cinara cedri]|uniref:Uncharacterized protein n=1 Tax=Cinara cedri TaxID=506608 RepID=A0A5E4NH05_9HEMI|nr:Hypothetical protein CINCED_3A002366 [Cinara cedri]